jgi:hypothetical protein
MTSHRTILMTLISLTAMSFATPSSVLAGPLLGGYGGPGAGNQAILGSALLGGGGSSGGSSGSTGSSPGAAAETAGGQSGRSQSNGSVTGSSGLSSTTASRRSRGSARGGAASSRDNTAESSGGAARAYPVSLSRSTPGASDTLGLSGADLAYIFLTLCALILTGVLTRRFAQAAGTARDVMTQGTARRTRVTE